MQRQHCLRQVGGTIACDGGWGDRHLLRAMFYISISHFSLISLQLITWIYALLIHRKRSPCLAAARSRRGSDMPPAYHSLPRRRFATPIPTIKQYRLTQPVGIGVLDDPKTDDSTNLYGNKPRRRSNFYLPQRGRWRRRRRMRRAPSLIALFL